MSYLPRGAISWADVVRAWTAAGEDGVSVEALTSALGFRTKPVYSKKSEPENIERIQEFNPRMAKAYESPEPSQSIVPMFRAPAVFWRCVEYMPNEELNASKESQPEGASSAMSTPEVPVDKVSLSLVSKAKALTLLQSGLAVDQNTRRLNVKAYVRGCARGGVPWPLPYQKVRRWPRCLTLWLDRSRAMELVWDDQIELHIWLKHLLGERLKTHLLPDGVPLPPEPDETEPSPWQALSGAHHLFVTDLGWEAGRETHLRWRALGYSLRSFGVHACVLSPIPLPSQVAMHGFKAIAWTSSPPLDEEVFERFQTLAALFPAVTTGVMRRLRRCSVFGVRAGIEAERRLRASSKAAVNAFGVSLRASEMAERREQLWGLSTPMLRGVGEILEGLPSGDLARDPGNWVESVTCVDGLAGEHRREVLSLATRQEAACLLQASKEGTEDFQVWRQRFAERTAFLDINQISPTLRDEVRAVRDEAGLAERAGASPSHRGPMYLVSNRKGELCLHSKPPDSGGWLAEMPRALSIRINGTIHGVHLDGPSLSGSAATAARTARIDKLRSDNPWADEVGEDVYGPWAEVILRRSAWATPKVSFTLRWVPPGTFLMGSPETEKGRLDWEGPVHQVTLSKGYWMATTPCTQAVWREVMDDNPSAYGGTQRPVETVSWDNAQTFLQRLNAQRPGLNLGLPTEAEWERACRAGTSGPHYGSPLDALAWFDGGDGTHDVGQKMPNGLGLYDMLGNVWEWCRDGLRNYAHSHDLAMHSAVIDPMGPMEEGTSRVVRGGGLRYDAWRVRAAGRHRFDPSFRDSSFGFRLTRGHSAPSQSSPGPGRPKQATEVGGPGSGGTPGQGGARGIRSGITLVTDRAEAQLDIFERPAWAAHVLRDKYGLYADVEIESSVPVSFKMRWIPPGEFYMGSPDTEAGRFNNEPQHLVQLTQGYWLADTPCTQQVWQVVTGKNPSEFKERQDALEHPVEQVSWDDVQEFMKVLNKRVPGLEVVLPTEAQWEYACRAGTQASRYGELDAVAWHPGNSDWNTHPVGRKVPNTWGVYDTLGNVWEWCADYYDDAYGHGSDIAMHSAVIDPIGPAGGADRVLRGGSWLGAARDVRAADRAHFDPSNRDSSIGFRLARGHSAPSQFSPGPVRPTQATEVGGPGSGGTPGQGGARKVLSDPENKSPNLLSRSRHRFRGKN